jgi:hypothetical protein
MKIPGLKKVKISHIQTKARIEEMIKETRTCDYIASYPIEGFTIHELDLLTEYATENNLIVSLKAEHSNFHQGVTVGLLRKDLLS